MSKSHQQDAAHKPAMKALIIYDDIASAVGATAALQRAANQAGAAVQWNIIPWQLDVLRLLPAADVALRDAVDAHLIVFSGRRALAFSPWLQRWLERWAAQRHILDAAVAAVNGGNGVARSGLGTSALSSFAERYGLSFITNNRLRNGGKTPFPVRGIPSQGMPPVLPQLSIIADTTGDNSHQHWGINE